MNKPSGRGLAKAILTDTHFWLPVLAAIFGLALLVLVGRT
jgi:hypothetical protein